MAQANCLRVLYVSAERFTNEFITAIRERNTEAFRNRYRSLDMLLIDDIRFISGKEQTEESFFHTFDELHNANRQIVITSNCPPKDISVPERLRSRFAWGLVTDINPPDSEMRLSILRAKAERGGVELPLVALETISQRAQANIRELEGLLNRVIAYAKLTRTVPTPEITAQALADIASKQPKTTVITPERVIAAVASSFELTPADLKGRQKDKATAAARQMAMYIIRRETNCSLLQIGQALGGKNPSTVSHACEKMVRDIDSSLYFKCKVTDIEKILYSH
jgi:chromosomal replication initiator protein